MKEITLKVSDRCDILKYILENTDYKKNKVKSLFKYKQVYLNGNLVKKLPIIVNKNDIISIKLEKNITPSFNIIYEDDEILVVDKKSGLLTIGTSNHDSDTLYRRVREYAKKCNFQVFIVNRLDKETSGIVMFAKSERVKMNYQNNWNELVTKRSYIALVEGKIKKDGRIENYLFEENNTFVHSSTIGKKAITNYHVLKFNNTYTLLDVNIETGRKNQIRVHLSELGYPVVGDKKYGSKLNPINRMCLHSYELDIKNPITGKIYKFKSSCPKEIYELIN